jgi:hypothetical protein
MKCSNYETPDYATFSMLCRPSWFALKIPINTSLSGLYKHRPTLRKFPSSSTLFLPRCILSAVGITKVNLQQPLASRGLALEKGREKQEVVSWIWADDWASLGLSSSAGSDTSFPRTLSYSERTPWTKRLLHSSVAMKPPSWLIPDHFFFLRYSTVLEGPWPPHM